MPLTDTQLQIIRQSSLNRAVDLVIADKCDSKDTLRLSERFVNYVINGIDKSKQ